MSDSIKVEINGKSCEAQPGEMLIQVADREGFSIPRFCYHEKLPIAASCRMCLVEVEKAPKPLPACATPVADGMVVRTESEYARNAQKAVMEFLLINHPLDCPICDQGGECELQDLAVGYGRGVSRFSETKRVVADKDIGPLVNTEMTRCIHCTRCIRTLEVVGGFKELGATGRGENTRIGTYIERSIDSEMSGNIIDVCPVGALTSKPFRYSARTWELTQHKSVAPHDCMGSNVSLHSLRSKILRVVPRTNESINEVWLSDRDRFSYEALSHEDRLTTPMVKENGEWKEVDWESALHAASQGLRGVVDRDGVNGLGCLVSPSSTLEEAFLAQKLMSGLGVSSIDHRLRQADFSDDSGMDVFPSLGCTIADVETLNSVLLVGSNIRKEQPIAAVRLRKAAANGANVMCVNPVAYDFNLAIGEQIIAGGKALIDVLSGIHNALTGKGKSTDVEESIADKLKSGERSAVMVGAMGMNHAQSGELRVLASKIANASGASFGYLTEGANAAGAWLAGAVPHRDAAGASLDVCGSNAADMISNAKQGYLLIGVEPELDCGDSAAAAAAMASAEMVVAVSSYLSDALKATATVLLPAAAWAETSGTYVNTEGTWQSFPAAIKAQGDARPAWKILRVLGNLIDLEGFEQISSEDVRDELAALVGDNVTSSNKHEAVKANKIEDSAYWRIGETPIHSVDMTVRRASSLQQTTDSVAAVAKIHSSDADSLGLADAAEIAIKQGGARVVLPLQIDDNIAPGCAWIPAGIPETISLGAAMGPVELERA